MSLLVAGWVRADAFGADLSGCDLCGSFADPMVAGWVHFATEGFVCARCLPDPDAEDAGEQAADRLAQRQHDEWRDWPL